MAKALAVVWRTVVAEFHASVDPTDQSWHNDIGNNQMTEEHAALEFLLHKQRELKEDGESEEEDSKAIEPLSEKTEPEPNHGAISDRSEDVQEPEPAPEPEPQVHDLLEEAAAQALLLEAAIASAAPWELARMPTGGATGEPQDDPDCFEHPAFRSQSSMEAAAFGYLEHHLPGFGASNWRSKHRESYFGLDGSPLDASGFAFEYDDCDGLLSPDGAPARLLISVKGSSTRSFQLSPEEHTTILNCAQPGQAELALSPAVSSSESGRPIDIIDPLVSLFADQGEEMHTEFVLLHLEAADPQTAGANPRTAVKVSHCVHNPGRLLGVGLSVTPQSYTASWS